MTVNARTGEPEFVVVHAKIDRGAFARWLIQNKINDLKKIPNFSSLGYTYENNLSSVTQPIFVCDTFQGIGLSVRISKSQ